MKRINVQKKVADLAQYSAVWSSMSFMVKSMVWDHVRRGISGTSFL